MTPTLSQLESIVERHGGYIFYGRESDKRMTASEFPNEKAINSALADLENAGAQVSVSVHGTITIIRREKAWK